MFILKYSLHYTSDNSEWLTKEIYRLMLCRKMSALYFVYFNTLDRPRLLSYTYFLTNVQHFSYQLMLYDI